MGRGSGRTKSHQQERTWGPQTSEPKPKKKQKATNPVFVLNSSEDPCHHGILGSLSRVTQACAAHAPAQQKKRTAVQDWWIQAVLSAESWESLTSKETNSHPFFPSHSILPPNPSPQRGKINKTTTNTGNCTRAVSWRQGQLQQLLGCALHLIPERWLQSWKRYSHAEPVSSSSMAGAEKSD